MPRWHARFMTLANCAASWSKDANCKVGACLVSPDKRSFAFGYNGFPEGLADDERPNKNAYTVHAEVNAIINARRDVSGWSLYCTKAPCFNCAKAILQAGIAQVVFPEPDENSSWIDENNLALAMFKEAKIVSYFVRGQDLILI